MLNVTDLQYSYGAVQTVRGVSIDVPAGQVTCVIGRNGVGKTTLLKNIMGTLKQSGGQVLLGGQDVTTLAANQRAKAGIALVPQGRMIFPKLTIEENLKVGLQARADGRRAIPPEVYDTFPVLKQMIKRMGGDLSGGQQQQLAIARALAAAPSLLVLDEPTEGIQPSIIKEIERAIRALAGTGEMAILLVEQYYDFARSLADQYLVMQRGEIVARGAGADMERDGVKRLLAV